MARSNGASSGRRRKDAFMRVVAGQMLKARGPLTQEQAGARVGISGDRWGSYERADRVVPFTILRKLPGAFHYSLNFFFGLPDERSLDETEQRIIGKARSFHDNDLKDAALSSVEATLDGGLKQDQTLQERLIQLEHLRSG